MKFANIHFLFFIWALPVLFVVCVWGERRRRKIMSAYSTGRARESISPDADRNRRRIKTAFLLLALFLIIIAMSGPQHGYKWQEMERKGIDIIIALDCSRSMLADDIRPSRLDRAKREILDLIRMLEGDRIGLVAFAGEAFLQCPLTMDYEAFHIFLGSLTPDFMPVGGTDLDAAIRTSMSGFDSEDNSEKAVIIITDGESTTGDPETAAKEAAKAGVKIFCIGVGRQDGIPVPGKDGFKKDSSGNIVLTKIDENTLRLISKETKGAYVRSVAGDMDLDLIYKGEIRGKMKRATLSSTRKKVWEDRYQWFLGGAFIMLLADLFVGSVKKSTIALILFILLPFGGNTESAHAFTVIKPSEESAAGAYGAEDYETALKRYIDEQLEDPDNPQIYYNIGNAYYRMGDYENALQHYSKALSCDDKHLKEKAFYNRGNTNFRLGKLEDALKDYEKAVELDPEDKDAEKNFEFVKKIIEESEKQKKESGDSQKNEKSDNEKSDKDNSGNNTKDRKKKDQENRQADSGQNGGGKEQGDKSEGKSDDREFGSEMKESAGGARNMKDDSSRDEAEEEEKKAGAFGQSHGQQPESSQSEKILNRLEDKPGRAMIPGYGKRVIDKDW